MLLYKRQLSYILLKQSVLNQGKHSFICEKNEPLRCPPDEADISPVCLGSKYLGVGAEFEYYNLCKCRSTTADQQIKARQYVQYLDNHVHFPDFDVSSPTPHSCMMTDISELLPISSQYTCFLHFNPLLVAKKATSLYLCKIPNDQQWGAALLPALM